MSQCSKLQIIAIYEKCTTSSQFFIHFSSGLSRPGGWLEKKYSRAESFSSLLNLILIYSLMMIQRIAAGLCFIFYIFQNVVGLERSWRRSSQILYHRREEGRWGGRARGELSEVK